MLRHRPLTLHIWTPSTLAKHQSFYSLHTCFLQAISPENLKSSSHLRCIRRLKLHCLLSAVSYINRYGNYKVGILWMWNVEYSLSDRGEDVFSALSWKQEYIFDQICWCPSKFYPQELPGIFIQLFTGSINESHTTPKEQAKNLHPTVYPSAFDPCYGRSRVQILARSYQRL